MTLSRYTPVDASATSETAPRIPSSFVTLRANRLKVQSDQVTPARRSSVVYEGIVTRGTVASDVNSSPRSPTYAKVPPTKPFVSVLMANSLSTANVAVQSAENGSASPASATMPPLVGSDSSASV
jgi:hypothetical protein